MWTAKTGGKDVFLTLTMIAVGDTGTSIVLGVGPEAITLDLEFRSDEHAKDQPVTFTPVDPHRGKIEFVNWDQPLSTTFAAPVEVGTAQNRRLYLIFSIRRIGSTGALREIHLTALLGEMV